MVSGGMFPYHYSWNNGDSSANRNGLCPGGYTVVVTDANGCTRSGVTFIANDSLGDPCATLNLTVNHMNANGGNCNGTASAMVFGGQPLYHYNWNNGDSSANRNGLCPGGYTVVVTDANNMYRSGVTFIANDSLGDPCATLNLTVNHMNATGGNCNGTASAMVTGGMFPYHYSWNNGDSSANRNGLCPGGYTVVVTDANGCSRNGVTFIANDSLGDPCATLNLTVNHMNANGGNCNGTASAMVTGGMFPYHYSWNNGDSSANRNGLCPGSYTVVVTDANGCTRGGIAFIANDSLGDPCATLNLTVNHMNANERCNGTASAMVTGGMFPYHYSWNNGDSSANRNGLCPGGYTVVVTDV